MMAGKPNEAVVPDAQVSHDDSTVLPEPVIAELLTGHVVTFLVGSPPTEFSVHEKVLKTTDSGFFQVAFGNGFEETWIGVFKLPEDDPESFQLLLHWIYGNAADFVKCDQEFFKYVNSSVLLKLYALASKYMLRTLHGAIISRMCNYTNTTSWLQAGLDEDAWEYFEANTMEQCSMDKLLVHWDGRHCDGLLRVALKSVHKIPRNNFYQGYRSLGTLESYFWKSEEAREAPERYVVYKTPGAFRRTLRNDKPTRHVLRVGLEEWEDYEEPEDSKGHEDCKK